jgi:hypothetical protein
MSFYGDMQTLATGLLTEFNQGGLALSVATPGAGPPHNPGATTYADTAFVGAARGVAQEHVDGTLVLTTDLQVTAPGTLTPKMSDRVKIGGIAHAMVKIIPKPATGTVVAYILIVRK